VIEVLTNKKLHSLGKQLLPSSVLPGDVAPGGRKEGQRSQGATPKEEMINRVRVFIAKGANTIINSAIR